MFDIADPLARRLGDAVDIGLQPGLSVRQRQLPQVLAPFEQQVEGEIDQPARLPVRDRRLQRREVRHVIFGQGAQLSIHHRVRPYRRVGRVLGKLRRPVQPGARVELRLPSPDGDLHPIAVELDLVRPARTAGRVVDDLAELDRGEGRRPGRLAGQRLGRLRFRRRLLACLLRRDPLRLASGDLRQRPAGRHRGVDLGQGVAFARNRMLVLFLDQQPVRPRLAGLLRFSPVGLQPDQRPFPDQPFAVQHHLDLALAERLIEVRLLRLPRPRVPHLHRASAVVAGRNRPLERPIIQRMVLDLDCQPLDRDVARRRLGDRPRLQDPVDLDAEVIVQPRRRVPLDQIA